MDSQLLPEGFRDSLPMVAKKEYILNSKFVELMFSSGFSIVKPPLAEFENSLFFLNKSSKNTESFRVLDPISQKMMGLRNDITLQIARISCGSLKDYPRPLRLIYSGEILRVKNNSLNLSRQFTQIGGEIIGIKKLSLESEIIEILINILRSFKINNYFVSFNMPTLIGTLCDDFKFSESQRNLIIKKYKNKNVGDLNKISNKLEEISIFLFSCVGDARHNLNKIKKYQFPSNTQKEIDNFLKIMNKLLKLFPKAKILIDPLEIDESEYHNGLAFKVYSANFKELFSGGTYNVADENCVGFSGLLDNLVLESKISDSSRKKICTPSNISNKDMKLLFKKGFMVIRTEIDDKKKEILAYAKENKCPYVFYKNNILKVKR